MQANPKKFWRARSAELFGKMEFGDFVFFFYIAAFAREYFWIVRQQPAAWTLTLVLALAAWTLYLAVKEERSERLPRMFWLIVALPLAFVYLLRVPFPDFSFDVLNYRLQHSERALRGFLFITGDFFPTPAPYNPAPDILTGIFRRLLGYRLGTIINLLALLWAGTIVERLLRDYVARTPVRLLCVVGVLFTEHIFFEINNYYVDILPLPLMLEALRLSIARRAEGERLMRDATVAAFLLGASIAFKIANLAFALPIALVFAYNARGTRLQTYLKSLALSALSFAAPLLPFTIFIYMQTGNPVFPLYNAVFKSPYWPEINVLDPRWGPKGLWETIVWPALVFFKPERFSEIVAYSGRISLGFVVALLCLFLARRDARARAVGLICVVSALLWSAGSGYVRYALFIELVGGILLVWLAVRLSQMNLSSAVRRAATLSVGAILFAQILGACVYISKYEWAMRPTVFQKWRGWRQEARFILRDHDLRKFVGASEREMIDAVEVWFESAHKSNAFESLLRPDLPILTVRTNQFFANQKSRDRFKKTLAPLQAKRIYSLALYEYAPEARREIESKGFRVGRITPLVIPYFSTQTRLTLALIEILPRADERESVRQDGERRASKAAPLPLDGFAARLSATHPPIEVSAGQKAAVRVTVRNESDVVWHAGMEGEWALRITLANRWLDREGLRVVNDMDARAVLPADLAPRDEQEFVIEVKAPEQPGEYILEFDMVQEQVAFFRERGSDPLRLRVRVK